MALASLECDRLCGVIGHENQGLSAPVHSEVHGIHLARVGLGQDLAVDHQTPQAAHDFDFLIDEQRNWEH